MYPDNRVRDGLHMKNATIKFLLPTMLSPYQKQVFTTKFKSSESENFTSEVFHRALKRRSLRRWAFFHVLWVQVQQEKIIRENRFQGGRKSALSGCNSHFHMYAKTQLGRCAARKSAF